MTKLRIAIFLILALVVAGRSHSAEYKPLCRNSSTGKIEQCTGTLDNTQAPTNLALVSGAAQALYLQEPTSDIVGYETLRSQPSSLPEDWDEVTVSSGTSPVAMDSYATDPGIPGINQWPAGNWIFHVHATVDSNGGDTRIASSVYSRTVGGVETLLFTATSPELDTGTTEYQWNTVQPLYLTAQTDRLIVKFFATTTSTGARTVRIYYQGVTRTSYITTPIPSPVPISGAANQVLATPLGSDGAVTLRKVASNDFTDGTLAVSKLLGGTSNYFVASNGTYGVWVNTPVGWTISGASNTFTNIPANTALTNAVPAVNGGTGQTAYSVGDLLYASTTTALSKLSMGTAGHVLTSNGAGVAPSMQAPIAGTVVSGTFSGTYDVPKTTFANVGLSLVLAAGQWHVTFDVRNLVNTSAGNGFVRLRLYDTTAGAVITDSETQGFLSATTGAAYGGTTSISKDITLTVTSTINLQAARDAVATYNAAQVIGDSEGWTRGTAFRRQ